MKKLKTFWLFGLLAVLPAWGASAKPVEWGDAFAPLLQDYFAASLRGEAATLPDNVSLSPAELATARERVWAAWRRALTAGEGELLPAPRALAHGDTTVWNLPAELEPHAAMPFFFGMKGERPQTGYPLFIYLHGSGPKQIEWATGLKLALSWKDAPSAYFIPQIPNEGQYYRWYLRSKQWAYERLLRLALASDWADPDRLYMLGISEGGYGSQRLSAFYADYLAAAGPMAGGEPQPNAPAENLAATAFFMRTGSKDYAFYRNRLTAATGRALDSLARLHPNSYRHDVALEEGSGHHIDYSLDTPWLLRHRRNPYPHYFCWENFEMDGRRRTGFYNLSLPDGAAAGPERLRYEMQIKGNSIDLRVDSVLATVTERDPRFGIVLGVSKRLVPAASGRLRVFLCDSLVDLSRRVTINVNGRRVFRGKVRPTLHALLLSTRQFADPRRVFPAMVEVEF